LSYETSDGYSPDDRRLVQEHILETLVMGKGYDTLTREKYTPNNYECVVWGYRSPSERIDEDP